MAREETNTAASERYLSLGCKLSQAAFENQRALALEWCTSNANSLNESGKEACRRLEAFSLNENTRALVVIHAYADIPAGRVYDLAFDLAEQKRVATRAELLFGIFWRRLPVLSLAHGHHQLAVFCFAHGVPALIDDLPFDKPERAVAALCGSSDWAAIDRGGKRQ
ncbi:hypothetical protein ACFJIW_11875 [Tahibacter sp. UC22_41]|uniref:hypothetical protein n=1 Tax=Tahibacter sp. UC22_41 TaxID=3350178 RepID=UPI0036D9D6AA